MIQSASLYNLATLGYLVTLSCFTMHLVNTRRTLLKVGLLILAISFLLQTSGMVFRWAEAGHLEVLATEKALGYFLNGLKWFVVFFQHPPWSNLYEIMMYMSWGIVLVTMAFEIFWQIPWIRLMGVMLALMALGVSSLTDSAIKPLVPALKSWWIMIHVVSASIAYAAGSIAAFICLLALVKDKERVVKEKLQAWAMVFLGLLIIFLGGAEGLIFKQAYFIKVLALAGEQVVQVYNLASENKSSLLMPMPGVGPMLLLTAVFKLSFGFLILAYNKIRKYSSILFLIAFLLSAVSCLLMLAHDVTQTKILLDPSIKAHLSSNGPYFMGFKSHPWNLFLMFIIIAIEAFLCIYALQPQKLRNSLPKIEVLEYSSYKAICLAFFLMTVVLITGALWAHYAWGRYWAWDPKETGALAIWLNYAIYLHTKRTKGLSGPFSSCIGIAGFFIIIIGFLGVNLGLFAQGLHTYGNS